jgi:predicted nucleic acid-binding protein
LKAAAYVDSSCLVAIATGEPGFRELMARLARYERLFSSNLLESEVRSVLRRKRIEENPGSLLAWITWVHPGRRLTAEFRQVLDVASLRGADLWHLACALFLRPKDQNLAFITLDGSQGDAARELGFPAG